MKQNYQKELDKKIEMLCQEARVPRLLIHSCCAPCSSYVLEYLSQYFKITVFYYNPNITEREEYEKRVKEQQRLIRELPAKHPIDFVEGTYEPQKFTTAVRGMEQIPEGGARCEVCFRMRLLETAKLAAGREFDYFTTTLTISPLKNAQLLNAIGDEIQQQIPGAHFLHSDFKKKNGYKRSVELSEIYHLYRQDYCGCIYSRQERQRQKEMMSQKNAPQGCDQMQ